MVKVVEFQDRAYERLEEFGSNPGTLRALAYARYASTPSGWTTRGGRKSGLSAARSFIPFSARKHKPHQMHEQHRDSCIRVLKFLVWRMDVKTRQCVHVNPARKTRRTLYVPEIARHTSLCERTVTRVLATLCKARYLLRIAERFYLTEHLFVDLRLSVTLSTLTRQLQGLDKKASIAKGSKGTKPLNPSHSPASTPASQNNSPDDTPCRPKVLTDASRAIGNAALSLMPGRRQRPPSG